MKIIVDDKKNLDKAMKTLKKILAILFLIVAAVLVCGGVTAIGSIPLGACAYFLLKDAGVDMG